MEKLLYCCAEFRAQQNNQIENLKRISKTYIESTWQCSNGRSNYSAANQSRPSAWWKLTMIVKYVHSFCSICLLLYLHSSIAAAPPTTTMQAGTATGLKCILRIRRVHWRKLGFVLLYYFAFTYVCVSTQNRTHWLTGTHNFYWHSGNGWQAVAIFMRTFISGRAASA